jgi:hypothetical protein
LGFATACNTSDLSFSCNKFANAIEPLTPC